MQGKSWHVATDFRPDKSLLTQGALVADKPFQQRSECRSEERTNNVAPFWIFVLLQDQLYYIFQVLWTLDVS